ncbi:UNKNOWN [Stylonychia lemnae]|uniref:Jacalin-type lectin domain-containing protein n=1 Tax=Stylonychia lemnae TaxID=5949 RepID=A0A077ZUJ1_STYLE|nr:UNKNOWN [Stylonychia lemnae]|eukprot:CDW72965.1 UNKNOWN [Stylonychia lemnae]
MGCGQTKFKPHYIQNYELVELFGGPMNEEKTEFKPKKQLLLEQKQIFDDMRFIEKATSFHLDRIEVFMNEGLCCGIGVTFNLDGLVFNKNHKGTKLPKTSYELQLAQNENIEFIQVNYSDEGIHDIILKSNLGNMLVMDDEYGNDGDLQTVEYNLGDDHDALIGFKGMADDYITKLSFYKATRVDAPISQLRTQATRKKQPMRLSSNIDGVSGEEDDDAGLNHTKSPPKMRTAGQQRYQKPILEDI